MLQEMRQESSLPSVQESVGIFTVSINYDDKRWKRFDDSPYIISSRKLKIGSRRFRTSTYLPIRSRGQHTVQMEYICLERRTMNQEAMDAAAHQGLRLPDRAETETFLCMYLTETGKFPIICLCGVLVAHKGHKDIVYIHTGVCAGASYRFLGLDCLNAHWGEKCRFLAVREG